MAELLGSSWIGVAFAVACIAVALGLVLRYRALERAGTPLPPGAGGARLRGVTTVVAEPHVPGRTAGLVTVLGDDWRIAEDVQERLEAGTRVEIVEVVGTRLVVRRIERTDDREQHATDPSEETP